MKAYKTYLPERFHQRVVGAIDGRGLTFSEFVREALADKLDREQVVEQVTQTRQDLAEVVDQLRTEIARVRRDLMDDHQQGMALIREDIQRSIAKQEEVQKAFLRLLGGAVSGPPSAPPPSRASPAPEPMRIPD